jgi:hypothetical protein
MIDNSAMPSDKVEICQTVKRVARTRWDVKKIKTIDKICSIAYIKWAKTPNVLREKPQMYGL